MAQEIKLCPNSPNCVSSRADEAKDKYVDPIIYSGDLSKIKNQLEKTMEAFSGVKYEKKEDNYWHLVFTTPILRFKDDIEFVFDDTKKQIMVRSASRVGYYDLGANRKRIDKIKSALQDVQRSEGLKP